MSRLKQYYVFILVASFLLACRDRQPGKTPASVMVTPSAPSGGVTAATGWDSAAGPILVLPLSPDSQQLSIVLPGLADSALAARSHFELAAYDDTPIDLFGPSGLVGRGVMRVASQSADVAGCVSWPSARFETTVASGWKVGFEKGHATALRLQSLAGMSAVDSAAFVSDVLRAATQLSSSGSLTFHGLPFSVRRGYRVLDASGPRVIVAEVARQINEEANPREEHTLLVAEEDSQRGAYEIAFTSRSTGPEESLETTDVLAAIRIEGRPAVVLSIEYEDGSKVGLLERVSNTKWTMKWKSAYTGC